MYCIFGVKLVAIVLLFGLAHCACPPGYTHSFGKKCYFFKDHYTKLFGNVRLCKKSGGTLASIVSKEENQFLLSILTRDKWYCIGLSRPKVAVPQFTWMDGSIVNYTNWCSSCPVHLRKSEWGAYLNSNNGFWYDFSVNTYCFQLCQWVDKDWKKAGPVTHLNDKVLKRQEKLTRDFRELFKHAIERGSDVTRNLTVVVEKTTTIGLVPKRRRIERQL